MNVKEKAKELISKYQGLNISVFGCSEGSNPCVISASMFTKCAIDCALIAVDEIIESSPYSVAHKYYDQDNFDYWQNVKKELENLKM